MYVEEVNESALWILHTFRTVRYMSTVVHICNGFVGLGFVGLSQAVCTYCTAW